MAYSPNEGVRGQEVLWRLKDHNLKEEIVVGGQDA